MKTLSRLCCVALSLALFPFHVSAAKPKAASPGQTEAAPAATLESTLASMDKASANFKTIQASFVWDAYQKLVDETDTQTGTIYFRRTSPDNVEMAAHIDKPAAIIVVYSRGVIRIYNVKTREVQERQAGEHKEEFNSFLILGFGGRGSDLASKFEVKFDGTENVQGLATSKLVLTPKDRQVANMFSQIILWIDTARGISVQQKFIQPNSGDYRLAKYSEVRINPKISDDAFKIKGH